MAVTTATDAFRDTLDEFGSTPFSTKDIIERYSRSYPVEWNRIESSYGVGGKGAGKHYSAFSYISQVLERLRREGVVEKLRPRKAPEGWGSTIIRYWRLINHFSGANLFPEEANTPFFEGVKTKIEVNKFERNKEARSKCIEYHGLSCKVCGIKFEEIYGDHGAGFIHVHHLAPISKASGSYKIDPINDLCPICPNCHAMIHYKTPMLEIEQLREIFRQNSKAKT